MGNCHQVVIYDVGKIVGREAVRFQEHLVIQLGVLNRDLPIDRVFKGGAALFRDALADHKTFSCLHLFDCIFLGQQPARVTPLGCICTFRLIFLPAKTSVSRTQFEQPLATAGQLRFESDGKPKVVAIGRVHIEEDAGKMIHLDSSAIQPAKSIVDYNRAGVPLIEIVTEPDIDSPKEAADFVRAVRLQLHRLGICEGRMAEGNLRCDANLSIRQPGQQKAGIKTELKNLNSFRAIERSLEFEIQRQTSCLREGRPIRPETRLWDEDAQQTFLLRSKESSPDYRYFPEPDLPPLIISPDMIEKLHRQVPVPPLDKKREYIARYGLPAERAQLLIEHPDYAQFFLAVIERYHNARSVAAWFFNRLLSHTGDLTNLHISPAEFADFLQRIDNADISHGLAAEILARSFQEKRSLPNILADQELQQIHEISPIETWCRSVLREFPRQVMEYRDGKVQLLGFFVGQVMQKSNRRADPNLVKSILLEMLKP